MTDRCESLRKFRALDAAYRPGDLVALRTALGDPTDFPNCRQGDLAVCDYPLEDANYWSPLSFIAEMLQIGADPNYADRAGFPSLLAALSTDRPDRHDILRLLLQHGADTRQRGLNDWTPLHHAVWRRDLTAIRILLDHGADRAARTRIDDCSTPLNDAERASFAGAIELLRQTADNSAGTANEPRPRRR